MDDKLAQELGGQRLPPRTASMSPSLLSGDNEAPFAAFELKFIVNATVATRILEWARSHLSADPHAEVSGSGDYHVTTLCLDTQDYAAFHHAAEVRGAKYRVRRYGEEAFAWLEQKVRNKDRVKKRRTRVPLAEIAQLTAARWFDDEVRDAGLAPVCAIAYRRSAFFGDGDHGSFRLTLDRTIVGETRVAWQLDPLGASALAIVPDQVVCELKFREALPHLFKQLVAEIALEPASFSKYRKIMIAAGLVETKSTDAH